MKVKFKEWDCETAVNGYTNNGRIAIKLVDAETQEPIATATVNLMDEQLGEDEIFVKDYSENTGMAAALADAGVIDPAPTQTVQSGFVQISAYKLTPEFIDEIAALELS